MGGSQNRLPLFALLEHPRYKEQETFPLLHLTLFSIDKT
jgi:hypothetical protein